MVFLIDSRALSTAVEQDDVDVVLRALAASDRWGEVARSGLEDWSATERDRLRWLLVLHRDRGFVEEAFAALESAQRLWPGESVFLIELIIIARAHNGRYGSAVSALVESVNDEVRLSPVVDLLLSLEAGERGNFGLARDGFVRVSSDLSDSVRHYVVFYKSLASIVIGDSGRSVDLSGAVEEYLAYFYSILDRYASIEDAVRGVVFFNSMGLDSPAVLSIRALERIADRLTPEGRASLVFLLVAYHQHDSARAHVDACLGRDEFVASSAFMKAAASCALALRDPVFERRILTRWVPRDAGGLASLSAVRSRELSARAAVVGANRPLRVFVGLFGQFRSADSISDMLARVSADISAAVPGPISLHYGFATWRRSGARRLAPSDSTEFFRQLLPGEAQQLLQPRHGHTGGEVARVFPNLIARMLAYFGAAADRVVDADQLAGLFPGPVTVLVDDEEDVEREAREAAGGRQVPHLNQFKMWSRIARLRDALVVQRAAAGGDFDACLIMRNDLVYLGGDFASLICRVASIYEADRVFCDHDPHAEYIEGLGDRYIVAGARAADRIFGGYADHIDALSTEDFGSAVISRLAGHEMISKILFEGGFSASPVYNVNYGLNRGIFPSEALRESLAEDLRHLDDPTDRAAVERLILDLKEAK